MKLLVIDDHAIVRAGVKRLLAALPGVELHEAANGRDALTLFRAEKPDVVLLDINLPGIGGLELLRRLLLDNVRAFQAGREPIGLDPALPYGGICSVIGETPAWRATS